MDGNLSMNSHFENMTEKEMQDQVNPKMQLTDTTTMDTLKNFCGDNVKFFTGVTQIITKAGGIAIGMGDIVVKNDDGSFSVIKND